MYCKGTKNSEDGQITHKQLKYMEIVIDTFCFTKHLKNFFANFISTVHLSIKRLINSTITQLNK